MKHFKKLRLVIILVILSTIQFAIINSSEAAAKKILIIGNSYVFFNELPDMLNQLIESSGQKATVSMSAKPGWTLQQHANSNSTIQTIKSSKWDHVVLQEQSVIPAYKTDRTKRMIPAVKKLNQIIKANRGKTVLLMTWGRRDGLKHPQLNTYSKMQKELTNGYTQSAKAIRATIAPVGIAWSKVMASEVVLPLYQNDGSHPNKAGSYLTACVLYATLYKKSPEGLKYTAGLGASKAQFLQKKAAQAVLTQQYKWNLK